MKLFKEVQALIENDQIKDVKIVEGRQSRLDQRAQATRSRISPLFIEIRKLKTRSDLITTELLKDPLNSKREAYNLKVELETNQENINKCVFYITDALSKLKDFATNLGTDAPDILDQMQHQADTYYKNVNLNYKQLLTNNK